LLYFINPKAIYDWRSSIRLISFKVEVDFSLGFTKKDVKVTFSYDALYIKIDDETILPQYVTRVESNEAVMLAMQRRQQRSDYYGSTLHCYNQQEKEMILGNYFFKQILMSKIYSSKGDDVSWERDGYRYTDDFTIEVRTVQIPTICFRARDKYTIDSFLNVYMKWKTSLYVRQQFIDDGFEDVKDLFFMK